MLHFFWKTRSLWDYVEECVTAKQATGDYTCIIQRMRIAWWIIKDIDTNSEYAILIVFPL